MNTPWEDEDKDHIIGEMMEVCANIEKYRGVIVITRNRRGKINWSWAGPDGEFDSADVLTLTDICRAETMNHLLSCSEDRKDDND